MIGNINIISKMSNCSECAHFLPKPIIQYSGNSKIVLIGQAPGIRAHQSNKPWNDASGKRLRLWLEMTKDTFYNKNILSIVPMGFCYPGKGKTGDLPSRPECSPKWHPQLIERDTSKTILLMGKYGQDYYLADKRTLTERVKNWRDYPAQLFPLLHPSPRNNIWLKKNSWFEKDILPQMQKIFRDII
jgi:uracil-DNA glycosylase